MGPALPRLRDPVYAAFDSDTDKNEREATDSLNSAEEVLQALGAPPGREVTPASITVTKRYACLDTNYETALRSSFPGYGDLEAEGGTLLGKSKQLRARHAARNLPEPDDEPAHWQRLKDLASMIGNMVPDAPGPAAGEDEPATPVRRGVSRPAAPR